MIEMLVTGLWWLTMGPLIAVELAVSLPIGVVSGGVAYLVDHPPIWEPVTIVHGPRYYSHKLDYPLVGASQWVYFGDEPENPPPRCVEYGTVDEETWAWKFEAKPETQGLRGDETRGHEQPGGAW